MARKPTRFWHPARRLLIQAQEEVRARVAKKNANADLDDVRPRLQHYLRAMYGESVSIEAHAPPKETSFAKRSLYKLSLLKKQIASESTPECIRLPETLPAQNANVSTLEQYRLLAVQHIERMRRFSANHEKEVSSDLERDLFQLAEAAAVDAQILESQPGLRSALELARAQSIAERPRPRFRSELELKIEQMVRETWPSDSSASANSDRHEVPRTNDGESNATWARRTAVALESKYGRKAAREYRRVPEITLWQTSIKTQLPEEQAQALESESKPMPSAAPQSPKNAQPATKLPGSSQTSASSSNDNSSTKKFEGDTESSVAKPDGTDTDDEQGEPNSEDGGESNEKNPNADAGAPPQLPEGADKGLGASAITHSDEQIDDTLLTGGTTFRYPEWDFGTQNFHPHGTIVRVMPPEAGSSEWARSALQKHAREVHRAKNQFERLRSHRARLRRQVQGDELDIEACVEAMVDRRMGVAPTDRLYSLVRPGRRELAITLLIDVSGSTRNEIAPDERVIDIERITAAIAATAFDALGDDYSILAFSSASASNVRVHTLKEFGEKNSSLVLQRIGALEPHGTTRLGAAVRHATAKLSKHPAPHRLLLIISDGRPFDYDWYFVDYAVQDSRHAIMSARLQGIQPFCITIDSSDEETYLPEIFGSTGYRVVSKPSQLAQALLQAVQRMIGTGA